MSDLLLIAVAIVLIVAVPGHVYVVWRYSRVVSGDSPASLNLMLLIVVCTAFGALMFALLGAHSVLFLQTGERLLPAPWPTLLIAMGAVVISIPLPFELRQLRRWSVDARNRTDALTRIETTVAETAEQVADLHEGTAPEKAS